LDLFLNAESDKGSVSICSVQCHLTFLCLFTQVMLSLVHRVVDSAIYDGDFTSCISYITIVGMGRGHKDDVRKEVRNMAYRVASVAHHKLFYGGFNEQGGHPQTSVGKFRLSTLLIQCKVHFSLRQTMHFAM